MDITLQPIYDRRRKKAEERLRFGMTPEMLLRGHKADIVRLKSYLGLQLGNRVVLLPVFDEILFSDDGSVAFCRIGTLWNLYDAITGEELVNDSFNALPIYNDMYKTLELVKARQQRGLYDLRTHRLLLNVEWDDVDCSADFSHLWVRRGTLWGFVEKATGCVLPLISDMQMAYEADGGLFLRYGDRIVCINERGVEDSLSLRRYVVAHNGRGMVRNAKYLRSAWFDVYGNIIE